MNGTQQGTVGWQGSFIQPEERVTSTAAFGQATWHISDPGGLPAACGGRMTPGEQGRRQLGLGLRPDRAAAADLPGE